MKKVIIAIFVLCSVKSFSQDSVKLTLSIQARDLEYVSAGILRAEIFETVWDSVKIKFRVQTPPAGNALVSVTGYTIDFYNLYLGVKNDPVAKEANCAARFETALRASNQAYLIGLLNAVDSSATTAAQQAFQNVRQAGRSRLRRQ